MLEIVETTLFRAATDAENPYSAQISRFFQTEFPTTAVVSKSDLFDILTDVILGTGNTRFGPKPNFESIVAIREVIREAITSNKPIPVLVPWGGRKTLANRSIDVAEVSALKQLSCLQAGVKKSYEPGLDIRIRVEDAGAHYLYQNEGVPGDQATIKYSMDFQKLVRVLNLSFINPIRESLLMNRDEYFTVANTIVEPMYEYIVESTALGILTSSKPFQKLLALGWKGEIPTEQREYYWRRYIAQDPEITPVAMSMKLAQYFAGSLARYKLKGTAEDAEWKGQYIKLMFVPPVPGAPISLVSKDISYRTVQEKMSRNHMPAWRCAGYLRIFDDKIVPALASFHQLPETTSHMTKLSRAGEEVMVQTDYLLER